MKNNICIAISTYKRKKKLSNLLKSIKNLNMNNQINLQILIVANDAINYQDLIEIYKKQLNIKLVREMNKGLANVRNKALKVIRKNNYKYIIFFDDDCEVDKKWFTEMIKMFNKTNADIIGGPQLTFSKSIFSQLLIRNEKHGIKTSWVSTNNVIMKSYVLKNNLNFSKKLNLIGGEDQLFFLNLNKMGFKLRWNAKAKVIENVKKNRENLLWFVKRNLRYGTSANLIFREVYGFGIGLALSFLKLILDFFKSFSYLLISITFSKKNFYKFVMYFCRTLGMIFGLLGYQYNEYK